MWTDIPRKRYFKRAMFYSVIALAAVEIKLGALSNGGVEPVGEFYVMAERLALERSELSSL